MYLNLKKNMHILSFSVVAVEELFRVTMCSLFSLYLTITVSGIGSQCLNLVLCERFILIKLKHDFIPRSSFKIIGFLDTS